MDSSCPQRRGELSKSWKESDPARGDHLLTLVADLHELTHLPSRPSKSGERLLALVWTYARCLTSRPRSRAAPGDHLPAPVAGLLELADFPQPAYEQSQVISFLALVADLHALTGLPSRPAGRAG